ncbi:MAG TPA: TlpA disulfide reductase family protein [Actinomycetota bacterium]|nr:TlpA disulfide reductase family protein [Actinomycetota bacterium]
MSDPSEPRSPHRLRRALLAFVPVVLFLGLLTYGLVRSAPPRLAAGERLPEFSLETLDGSGTVTNDDIAGHPTVINFWASWCIPCKQEARLLEKTYEAYKDDGVVFLGVNIKDAAPDAQAFADKYGITYLLVRDPEEDLASALGVTGIPETFFIDDSGAFVTTAAGDPRGERGGLVTLGPVSEADLTTNIDILVRRAD